MYELNSYIFFVLFSVIIFYSSFVFEVIYECVVVQVWTASGVTSAERGKRSRA